MRTLGFLGALDISETLFGPGDMSLRAFPFLCGIVGLFLFWRLAQRTLSGVAVSIATGRNLFISVGCQFCHTQTLSTGDLNGDGAGDLMISEAGWQGFTGRAWIYLSGRDGLAPARVIDSYPRTFGAVMSGGGDFDGDGYSDFATASIESPCIPRTRISRSVTSRICSRRSSAVMRGARGMARPSVAGAGVDPL